MDESKPNLIFAQDLYWQSETRQEHAAAVLHGSEVRVRRGVYVSRAVWEMLDGRARYVLLIKAVMGTRRNPSVVSHWSAAAIHGLPLIGKWPESVHVTQPRSAMMRSAGDIRRHSLELTEADIVEIDGMRVTSIARTVIDIASTASFASAVVVADRALLCDRFGRSQALTSPDDLLMHWHQRLPFTGSKRALEVIRFADGKAETPLESLSRVTMRSIGCPPPLLQSRFFDADGFIGETDFDWPEYGLVGEADGDVKYLDSAHRGGRDPGRVKLDEKIREDRLRALPKSVVRWRWDVAVNPEALRRTLERFGLPMLTKPWKR